MINLSMQKMTKKFSNRHNLALPYENNMKKIKKMITTRGICLQIEKFTLRIPSRHVLGHDKIGLPQFFPQKKLN